MKNTLIKFINKSILLMVMATRLSLSMEVDKPIFRHVSPDQNILDTYNSYYFYDADTPQAHRGASQIYNLSFPKAPLFHPYSLETELRTIDSVPLPFRVPLFLHMPSEQVDGLPEELDPYIPADMPRNKIDWMALVQNMPWTQGQPVLYRPHYYLEPNATYLGTYGTHNKNITAHCINFWGNPVSFSKNEMTASTHPANNVTVLSGPAPCSIFLNGVNNQQSSLFFTVFKHDDRLAVTFHALLSDTDHEALMEKLAARRYQRLADILEGPVDSLKDNSIFQFLYHIISW